jgi:hypothetical protein
MRNFPAKQQDSEITPALSFQPDGSLINVWERYKVRFFFGLRLIYFSTCPPFGVDLANFTVG